MTKPYKIYIFDLDDTLHHNYQLYPNIKSILTALRRNGHKIFIASFNTGAPNVLKQLGINHLFHGGSYGRGKTKFNMIEEIKQYLAYKGDTNYYAIEFFDDLISNITEVKLKGKNQIRAVHTPNGLRFDHI